MSTAAPPANDAAEAPPVRGSRKKVLILAGAALAVLLLAGGGAGYLITQQRKAAAAAAEGDEVPEVQAKKKDPHRKSAPVFLPLELFTVNLADREAERYAQVGVTLELADSKVSDQLKSYMPAIRNDILMLLAHKRADELQQREGKLALAREIRRAASKPLNNAEDGDPAADADADEEPVRAVHFSAFIIQ
jgi:flagellar protein FliL